jgi:hypothetical protein
MSARRYEVSFRATLTDREVDEVADKLFELGWDDIQFRPLQTLTFGWKICNECEQRYINWGAHAERCTGRPPRLQAGSVTWTS